MSHIYNIYQKTNGGECYKSIIKDIYCFDYGIHPGYNQIIKCIENNKIDLDKNSLIIIGYINPKIIATIFIISPITPDIMCAS